MSLFRSIARNPVISLGSPDDFARFYEQNHLNVFRYVMVLCAGNQEEAEVITADAFFRAWEKRALFSGSASAALGWVITIARNILIDQRRSAGSHPADSTLDEEMADQAGRIEEIMLQEEQIQQVLAAIKSLPFPQGDILTLRYALGWKVKAIASHLGLPENTVSVDLRRAVLSLQRKLVPQEIVARRAA